MDDYSRTSQTCLTHQLPLSPCIVSPIYMYIYIYIFIFYYCFIYIYIYIYIFIDILFIYCYFISCVAFHLSRHATWLVLVGPVASSVEIYCL